MSNPRPSNWHVQATTAVPGVGYLAYRKDMDGNTFCIMEEDTSAA